MATRRRTSVSASRELPGDLDWITLKAMEKDRTRRYASASELAADVGRYLNRDTVLARPAWMSYRIRKFVGKHRVGATAAILVTAAVIAGLMVSTVLYLRAESAREDAEWRGYIAAISAASSQLAASELTSASAADGADEAERILITVPADRRNWEWRIYRQTPRC